MFCLISKSDKKTPKRKYVFKEKKLEHMHNENIF